MPLGIERLPLFLPRMHGKRHGHTAQKRNALANQIILQLNLKNVMPMEAVVVSVPLSGTAQPRSGETRRHIAVECLFRSTLERRNDELAVAVARFPPSEPTTPSLL